MCLEVMGGSLCEFDGVAFGDEVDVLGWAVEEEVAEGAADEIEGRVGGVAGGDRAGYGAAGSAGKRR